MTLISASTQRMDELANITQLVRGHMNGIDEAVEQVVAKVSETDELLGVLKHRLAELNQEFTTAKDAAGAHGVRRGVELIDTTGLPYGPYPPATPILDLRLGVDELAQRAFRRSPIATAMSDIEDTLSRPLHRDVARVLGHPLAEVPLASGGTRHLTAARQVGAVDGYASVEEAIYRATHLASEPANRGPIIVVRGADDVGESRFLLTQTDDRAAALQLDETGGAAAARARAFAYRTEHGETVPAVGFADIDGNWQALDRASAQAAPAGNRSALLALDELDTSTVAHYAAQDLEKLRPIDEERSVVADLIRQLTAAQTQTLDAARTAADLPTIGALAKTALPVPRHVADVETAAKFTAMLTQFVEKSHRSYRNAAMDELVDAATKSGRSIDDVKDILSYIQPWKPGSEEWVRTAADVVRSDVSAQAMEDLTSYARRIVGREGAQSYPSEKLELIRSIAALPDGGDGGGLRTSALKGLGHALLNQPGTWFGHGKNKVSYSYLQFHRSDRTSWPAIRSFASGSPHAAEIVEQNAFRSAVSHSIVKDPAVVLDAALRSRLSPEDAAAVVERVLARNWNHNDVSEMAANELISAGRKAGLIPTEPAQGLR